ncbi:MAG: CoA transferase [Sphingobium sp.]
MPASAPVLPSLPAISAVPGALSGIRVVDFTRVLAGPFGTQILGDLGADVIKIENPKGGDDTRAIRRQEALGGEAPMFLSLNRSKRSVAVDLTREEGRQVVLDLLATADILVENFTGRVMRRFGLDYASLKERFPRLIYCSVSGYGRTGSNADAAGYDAPVAAEAGLTAMNAFAGGSPVLGAIAYTDITTALNATIAILAALHARGHTGEGQHVDVAMFDSALANLSFQGAEYLATGREPPLYRPQLPGPRGLFATADGDIVITCSSDKMFRAFCLEVIERPDLLEDPRFAVLTERMRNGEPLLAELRGVLLQQPRSYWSERCKRAGIPCGPVRSAGEALMSAEATERGLVFGLPHAIAGTAPAIAQPFRLSETPCQYASPPMLGQHTHAVLSALPGYDDARIAALEASGAIATISHPTA